MIVSPSPSESRRIGRPVGRLTIDAETAVEIDPAAFAGYDTVIVRHPAARRDVAGALAAVDGFALLPADHLCYWEWPASRFEPAELPDGLALDHAPPDAIVDALVRDSFDAYQNHYAVNPLFAPGDVVEGYVEWTHTLREAGAVTMTLRDHAEHVGIGVLAVDGARPDIKLAGMASAAQGRGWYGPLLAAFQRRSLELTGAGLVISTQSDNVRVMRAWARLGLLPYETYATQHLIRRDLLP